MAFIPDGYGQASIDFEFIAGPSNPMAIVIGYDYSGTPDPDAHAAAINLQWRTFVMTSVTLSNNLLCTGVRTLENPGGVSGQDTTTSQGGNALKSLPPQVSVLVAKSSLTGGRKGRGRMYVPGLSDEYQVEGGYLSPGGVTELQGKMNQFLAGLAGLEVPMVILHNDLGATIPSVVVGLSVQTILATQRRRIR